MKIYVLHQIGERYQQNFDSPKFFTNRRKAEKEAAKLFAGALDDFRREVFTESKDDAINKFCSDPDTASYYVIELSEYINAHLRDPDKEELLSMLKEISCTLKNKI